MNQKRRLKYTTIQFMTKWKQYKLIRRKLMLKPSKSWNKLKNNKKNRKQI